MRYFIEIAYKGTNYHGWQYQPNANSIQEEIQKTLTILFKTSVEIIGAGRTDAGVHAKQIFAHFNVKNTYNKNEFLYKANSLLPKDIVIKNIYKVTPEAHARFNAVNRSYEYKIYLGRNPFLTETTWQLTNKNLDIALMNKAAKQLFGYEDFKCFSKSKTDVKTYNCKITQALWKLDNHTLTFYITADRFLRNMVRAITGTLLKIGEHKLSITEFKKIIESRDRRKAGASVPAKGLFLTKVTYPKNIFDE